MTRPRREILYPYSVISKLILLIEPHDPLGTFSHVITRFCVYTPKGDLHPHTVHAQEAAGRVISQCTSLQIYLLFGSIAPINSTSRHVYHTRRRLSSDPLE